jgi:hypothetical protein
MVPGFARRSGTMSASDGTGNRGLHCCPGHRSSFAPAAIEHLHSAVDSYDSSYARPRAIHLPDLVGAYFRVGDLDTAVTTGHEAVTAISTLSSKLAYAGLRVLDTVADPFGHKPEVAELREHIRTALTSA